MESHVDIPDLLCFNWTKQAVFEDAGKHIK